MYIQHSEVVAAFLAANLHEAPPSVTMSPANMQHLGASLL